jgi:hypothetical protein
MSVTVKPKPAESQLISVEDLPDYLRAHQLRVVGCRWPAYGPPELLVAAAPPAHTPAASVEARPAADGVPQPTANS